MAPPTSLLLIDDDAELLRALSDFLKRQGFHVECVRSAEEAADRLSRRPPDLIILDLNLPEMSGFEFCKQIKSDPKFQAIPILILSGRAGEPDKVMGLDLGAEDYLVKPFGTRELLARIRALLRRTQGHSLQAGAIQIEIEPHTATLRGKPLRLSPKEFELLALLVSNRNRLLSRDHILHRIWPDVESMPNTLDVHIKRLRKKLGREGARIETYKGLGYKLVD